MVIDFHTHMFPERIARRTIEKLSLAAHLQPWSMATREDLLRTMAKAGVDLSIVLPVATSAGQVRKINDSAAAMNEAGSSEAEAAGRTGELGEAMSAGQIFSLGCMHPEFEDYKEELRRIRDLGLKGIKLHPVYQGVDIDDIRFLRILEEAASLGLIVITHAGIDIGVPGVHCSPRMCRHAMLEVAGKTKSFRLILAHMGGWRNWEEVPELLADTGVCLDTSFSTQSFTPLDDGYWSEEDSQMLSAAQFMAIVRAFGAERILFGTDHPWSDQAQSLRFIRSLPLTKREKEQILGENAHMLLNLHP